MCLMWDTLYVYKTVMSLKMTIILSLLNHFHIYTFLTNLWPLLQFWIPPLSPSLPPSPSLSILSLRTIYPFLLFSPHSPVYRGTHILWNKKTTVLYSKYDFKYSLKSTEKKTIIVLCKLNTVHRPISLYKFICKHILKQFSFLEQKIAYKLSSYSYCLQVWL